MWKVVEHGSGYIVEHTDGRRLMREKPHGGGRPGFRKWKRALNAALAAAIANRRDANKPTEHKR